MARNVPDDVNARNEGPAGDGPSQEWRGVKLPSPLMTSEPGSFARKTMVERKGQIIARVIADNDYLPEIVADLKQLGDEISQNGGPGREIQPVEESVGDAEFWNAHWARYEGRTWLELPWYFAETYFYRRLLEATRYFQPGPWFGHDPFTVQKRTQEASAAAQLRDVWPQIVATPPEKRFVPLLHACLWGNRADLSNFTVRESAMGDTTRDRANILIDDTERIRELLRPGAQHVAFINDNVGADSLFDLVMVDFLLTQGWVEQVTFHLKNQPFFVSDAMPNDIRHMVRRLRASSVEDVSALGERLEAAIVGGALILTTAPFWTRCLSFWEMPEPLLNLLGESHLVILKGDVNYRRLLDDRHWPPTASLKSIAAAFPRPFLVLRTLKGEIIVDLDPGQAEAMQAEDPTWLINGKRGLIQLIA
ncbi:MAG: damage-control phosphatase ARMT1 family protein [Anaerolineae bacterium]